jgi:GT2 family glycosyltransferase
MENSQKPPCVVIILLNWNSRMDTLECLESVFRLNYPDFQVVVCDNNSSDGSLESIQEWAQGHVSVTPASKKFDWIFVQTRPKQTLDCVRYSRDQVESLTEQREESELILIETGANLGFAGGNNVGIRYALKHLQPDYFWLLNTDTVVDKESLAALVDRASSDRHKTMGMVGSSLIYYWEPNKVQAMGGASLDRRTTRMCHIGIGSPVDAIPVDGSAVEAMMSYVVGASMLVSREFVEQVGLMCEDYFLYYEEIDWALRANGRFDFGYAPASKVFHKVGGSSQSVASMFSLRYLWRNRIKFVARFMPESLPGTLTIMALDMLRAFLKGKFGLSRVIAEALLDSRQLIAEGKTNKECAQS